jgi:hypothetical protein
VDDDYEDWRAAAVAMSTHPGECVLCYVHRMLAAFGCDGTLRWVVRWRDRRAPRAMALADRLTERGAHCDCELFSNAWELVRPADEASAFPACARARGATAPCDNWAPRRSLWW